MHSNTLQRCLGQGMVCFGGVAHLKFSLRVPPTCIMCLALKKLVVYLHYVAYCLGFGVIVSGFLWGFYKPTTAPDCLHTLQYVCQNDLILEE